jgi:hypothetical protein
MHKIEGERDSCLRRGLAARRWPAAHPRGLYCNAVNNCFQDKNILAVRV